MTLLTTLSVICRARHMAHRPALCMAAGTDLLFHMAVRVHAPAFKQGRLPCFLDCALMSDVFQPAISKGFSKIPARIKAGVSTAFKCLENQSVSGLSGCAVLYCRPHVARHCPDLRGSSCDSWTCWLANKFASLAASG